MKKRFFLFCILLFAFTLQMFSQTVYVSETGGKYHLSNCHDLGAGKTQIDLKTAITKGYTACTVCRPTQDITQNTLDNTHLDEKEDPETASVSYPQCTVKTVTGERRKRNTRITSGKCPLRERQ